MSKSVDTGKILRSLASAEANYRGQELEDSAEAISRVRKGVRAKASRRDETIDRDGLLRSLTSLKGNITRQGGGESVNEVIDRVGEILLDRYDQEVDLGRLNRTIRSVNAAGGEDSRVAVERVRELLASKTTSLKDNVDCESLKRTLIGMKGMVASEYGDVEALDTIDRVLQNFCG